MVKIQLYHTDYDYVYDLANEGLPDGVPTVSEDSYNEILDLPNVEAAAVYNHRTDYNNSFYFGSASSPAARSTASTTPYFSTAGYVIKQGRGFVPKDYTDFRPVAIIDSATADSPVPGGRTPSARPSSTTPSPWWWWVWWRRAPVPAGDQLIDDYYMYMGSGSAGKIFLPDAIWPSLYAYDEPQEVAVRCTHTEAMSTVGKAVADLLNENVTNETVKYQGEDVLQQAKELQDLSNATNQQLIWIASISLLVGGIGVMNIMLVSVTERTREIGLKKAIGARKSRILWQFLTEAAVLTSLGGPHRRGGRHRPGGAHLRLTQAPVAISLPFIFLAVLFSMAIGILFGLLPSVKAANLNPIDALRHE